MKFFKAIVLLSLTFVCIRASSAADWPMWRCDARRSAVTSEKLPPKLYVNWVRRLPAPEAAWPATQDKLQFDASYEPVVLGKILFIPSMTSDKITAYDTDTGEEKWRFYAEGPVRFAPVAWKDRVFIISDDGFLYCLEASSGDLLWKKRGGADDRTVLGNGRLISIWPARGAPVILEDTLYFAASVWPFMGTFIYALDPETGDILWCNSGSGSDYITQQHYAPSFSGVAPQGYIAASKEKLLISGGRTVPACYNRATGRFLYYEVADRTFGNACGGYGVSICGDKFFNGGIMYDIADGTAMAPTNATIFLGDKVIGANAEGGITAHSIVPDEEKYKNRYGKEKIRYKMREIQKWDAEEKIETIYFMAATTFYGTDEMGNIVAVEIPEQGQKAKIIWQTAIEGRIWNMLAADSKLFAITREGTVYCFSGEKSEVKILEDKVSPLSKTADLFPTILKNTRITEGWCLVLGIKDGKSIKEIVGKTNLHVVGVDPDAGKINRLRRVFDNAGIYGKRVSLLIGDPMKISLPPYMASLVISENPEGAATSEGGKFLEKIYQCLRPFGGTACLVLSPEEGGRFAAMSRGSKLPGLELEQENGMVFVRRSGALPGSADWTHQNANPANTLVSRDKRVKAPLGLLWFGGSSHEKILPRHGHGPTPQAAGGRLVIEGPDSLRAMDIYTGRIVWDRTFPKIGSYYDYTTHEPGANSLGSNYVTLEDAVYLAYTDRILRLDPETGKTIRDFTFPEERNEPDLGYLGILGDILVAGLMPGRFTRTMNSPGGSSSG